jgi:hypothetical protein
MTYEGWSVNRARPNPAVQQQKQPNPIPKPPQQIVPQPALKNVHDGNRTMNQNSLQKPPLQQMSQNNPNRNLSKSSSQTSPHTSSTVSSSNNIKSKNIGSNAGSTNTKGQHTQNNQRPQPVQQKQPAISSQVKKLIDSFQYHYRSCVNDIKRNDVNSLAKDYTQLSQVYNVLIKNTLPAGYNVYYYNIIQNIFTRGRQMRSMVKTSDQKNSSSQAYQGKNYAYNNAQKTIPQKGNTQKSNALSGNYKKH